MGTEPIDTNGGSANINYNEFVNTSERRGYIGLGLSVILLIDGVLVWEANIWAALISFIIGIVQLIIAGTLIPHINGCNELQNAGNVVVQHSWLLLSIGIAVLAIYPSPFLAVPQLWFAIAMLTGLGWVILGVVNLYQAVTQAGARSTV